jgi:hypothetical protein
MLILANHEILVIKFQSDCYKDVVVHFGLSNRHIFEQRYSVFLSVEPHPLEALSLVRIELGVKVLAFKTDDLWSLLVESVERLDHTPRNLLFLSVKLFRGFS